MKIARRGEFEKEKFTTVTGDFVRMLNSGSVCRKSLQNLFSNILGLANVMRCLREIAEN